MSNALHIGVRNAYIVSGPTFTSIGSFNSLTLTSLQMYDTITYAQDLSGNQYIIYLCSNYSNNNTSVTPYYKINTNSFNNVAGLTSKGIVPTGIITYNNYTLAIGWDPGSSPTAAIAGILTPTSTSFTVSQSASYASYFGNAAMSSIVDMADGTFLVIGGYNFGAGTFRNNVTSVNFASGSPTSYTECTVYPLSLLYGSSVKLNDGRILMIGGSTSSGPTNACYLGTKSGTTISWVASTSFPFVLSRSATVVLSNDSVIVFGATSSTTVGTSIYVGTVVGNSITWRLSTYNLSAYPTSNYVSAVLVSNKVYLCFGGTSAYQPLLVSIDNPQSL